MNILRQQIGNVPDNIPAQKVEQRTAPGRAHYQSCYAKGRRDINNRVRSGVAHTIARNHRPRGSFHLGILENLPRLRVLLPLALAVLSRDYGLFPDKEDIEPPPGLFGFLKREVERLPYSKDRAKQWIVRVVSRLSLQCRRHWAWWNVGFANLLLCRPFARQASQYQPNGQNGYRKIARVRLVGE